MDPQSAISLQGSGKRRLLRMNMDAHLYEQLQMYVTMKTVDNIHIYI